VTSHDGLAQYARVTSHDRLAQYARVTSHDRLAQHAGVTSSGMGGGGMDGVCREQFGQRHQRAIQLG